MNTNRHQRSGALHIASRKRASRTMRLTICVEQITDLLIVQLDVRNAEKKLHVVLHDHGTHALGG